jgi:hypothetical protein
LDNAEVKAAAEAVGKTQFAQYRDPHECMLLYLALGKKAVLQNLFRQVSDWYGRCRGVSFREVATGSLARMFAPSGIKIHDRYLRKTY